MKARVLNLNSPDQGRGAIAEAAACMAQGGLVIFPTETVYGVGASAVHPEALARLRQVKGRIDGKPFTVHVGSRASIDQFVPGLKGIARRLTDKALPGPLTLIFHVDDVPATPVCRVHGAEHADALYHEGTIGIRFPDDSAAMALLNQTGVPVVAASANPAGGPAPVDAAEAISQLGGDVDIILDGGRTRYAKASTIVKVSDGGCEVIRAGVIDERTVRRLTSLNFLLVCSGNTCRSPMAEGLLRYLLAERLGCRIDELEDRGYHVESAGTGAYSGAAASSGAVRVLKARGVDLSGHRSRPLDLARINRADYLFTMTASQLRAVVDMAGDFRGVARQLDDRDVEDPIGEDDNYYRQCADQIEQALRHRLEEISL